MYLPVYLLSRQFSNILSFRFKLNMYRTHSLRTRHNVDCESHADGHVHYSQLTWLNAHGVDETSQELAAPSVQITPTYIRLSHSSCLSFVSFPDYFSAA